MIRWITSLLINCRRCVSPWIFGEKIDCILIRTCKFLVKILKNLFYWFRHVIKSIFIFNISWINNLAKILLFIKCDINVEIIWHLEGSRRFIPLAFNYNPSVSIIYLDWTIWKIARYNITFISYHIYLLRYYLYPYNNWKRGKSGCTRRCGPYCFPIFLRLQSFSALLLTDSSFFPR